MSRLTTVREMECRSNLSALGNASRRREAQELGDELDAVRAERDALLKAARLARECRYIAQCQECPKRLDKAIAKETP